MRTIFFLIVGTLAGGSWFSGCVSLDAPAVHPEVVARLHLAAQNGDRAQIRWCLLKGHDVDARAGDGSTPLHTAARFGQIRVVRLLLESGATVEARNEAGLTPLDRALQEGHRDVAELLRHSASPGG